MVGSLANPEIDAASKGRSIAPVLFHVECRCDNMIIIIAAGLAREADHPEYHVRRSRDVTPISCGPNRWVFACCSLIDILAVDRHRPGRDTSFPQ